MNVDKILGPRRHNPLTLAQLKDLRETAQRSSTQHYTLQGYLSEISILKYLDGLRSITHLRKIPDFEDGHGGDVSFRYKGKLFRMEVKTLTLRDEKGTVSIVPTRKSDVVKAYRAKDFELVGVNISGRVTKNILFARTDELPRHKVNADFLQGTYAVKKSLEFAPFSFQLFPLLRK